MGIEIDGLAPAVSAVCSHLADRAYGPGRGGSATPWRIVIDGPSGSGKTTLAAELSQTLAGAFPELAGGVGVPPDKNRGQVPSVRRGILVLNVEEWTPGWDGMEAATKTTETLLTGQERCYRRWDWHRGQWAGSGTTSTQSLARPLPTTTSQPECGWVSVDPTVNWIVEGCGTLTAVTAQAATLSIWVQADPEIAKRRGLMREGEPYATNWQRWHLQERSHWARDRPAALADYVVQT